MNRDSLVKLRQQLDMAIESDKPEMYTALAQSFAEALRQMNTTQCDASVHGDELERALQAIENAWLKGSAPPEPLLSSANHQAGISMLLSDMLAVQSFALSMSRGDLSASLKAKGVMSGSLKALQGSLRHLAWQTRMVAKGDFSQRVDFMGEFSESFNSMVASLAKARDQIERHTEELLLANVSLTAEIAERRRVEEALCKARDTLEERVNERTAELSRSNESLRAYMTKLEWANCELSDFAFIASHDLQEPLRKIQILGDLLKIKAGDALGEDGQGLLERMRRAAEKMRSQIHALLDYACLTMKAEPFRPVDLDCLVREAIAAYGAQIEKTEATVEISHLPTIEADPGQMIILFRNLIGNALKFRGERNPVIRIHSRELSKGEILDSSGYDRWSHIFIEDNGIGFDEKYLGRVFKPFQRLHGWTGEEGTGMGLAICRKIVERHGGGITARSGPGQGSTFVITLPMKQAEIRRLCPVVSEGQPE